MDVNRVIRIVVLVLSAGAVVFGVLIMVGYLVPRTMVMPEGYQVIFGGVIVLYGVYRFVMTFVRKPRER